MVDIFARLEKMRVDPSVSTCRMLTAISPSPSWRGEIGPHMKFRGKMMLNWSLNNYLGLANHPEVRKADAEGAAQFGMAAPMGARMMSGQTSTTSSSSASWPSLSARRMPSCSTSAIRACSRSSTAC